VGDALSAQETTSLSIAHPVGRRNNFVVLSMTPRLGSGKASGSRLRYSDGDRTSDQAETSPATTLGET